uniref:Uncharacterized protein n=1 Tax=Biomphalaria glabrata TaxID=6526 RepID=A0A2C9K8W0_BIOGL
MLTKDLICVYIFTIYCVTFALSVCPTGWARSGSNCYFTFPELLNRSEASSLCAAHSSYLVSYSTQDDWDYISSLVKASNLDKGFWTGLELLRGAWTWDDSSPYKELYRWQTPNQPGINYVGYIPSPTNTLMWGKLVLNGTNVFLQLEANTTGLHPFCKREIDARDLCDTSENWVRLRAECYKLFPPSTWADAVNACRATSGHLLAPTKDADLTSITSLLTSNISIWVDATDLDSLGLFYTSTKDRVSYLPWLSDPTGGGYAINVNRTCALTAFNDSHFGYQTQSCTAELPFVCKMPQGTCPLGWIQDGIDCYQLHIRPEEKMTWSAAVDHCSRQGATMIQYAMTTRAKTILNKELQDNDINLVWIGFSGTGLDFRYIENDVVRDKIIEYDTTDITGTNSRCGVTDVAPDKSLNLAVYCFTPRNFICTASLTDTTNEIPPPNIRCDPGWTIYNDYCIKVELNPSNFTEAQNTCQRENASLFIINNDIDQSLFSTSTFLSEGIDYYWIGVIYDVTKSAYTLVNSADQPNIMNFDPQQRYSLSEEPCIFIETGSLCPFIGAWVRDVCSSKHKFVCQKAGVQVVNPTVDIHTLWSPRCSAGWLYSPDTNQCYLVSAFTRKTWQDARSDCNSQSGDLLSISGEVEQLYIEKLLKSNEFKHLEQPLWIGAKDVWNGHGWGWSDKSPFSYLHWGQAQPDYDSDDGNNCGYMPVAQTFEWESRSCLEKLGFICEKPSLPENNGAVPTQAPFKTCIPEPLISGVHSLQFATSFTASSYLDDYHRPENCRILSVDTDVYCQTFHIGQNDCHKSWAWSPANDSAEEWLAIHFHSPVTITDIILKGEDLTDKYVSKFKVQYQYDDSSPWIWIVDTDRYVKIFDGVSSPDSSTSFLLIGDLQAQAVKIWPLEWSYGIAIQIELMGCMEDLCQPEYALSGPLIVSDEQITSSSSKPGYLPLNARLEPVRQDQQLSYWMPNNSDTSPWIQVDLGKLRLIRGVTLEGNSMFNNYVTKFQLQFSQTTNISDFITYTEPYGSVKIFDGIGANQPSPMTVYLKSSVTARMVRLVVVDKNLQTALRWDVLVCSTGCLAEPVMNKRTNYRLSASSSQTNHLPEMSKLNTLRDGALADGWRPLDDRLPDTSYITVDLGTVMLVTAIATQGSASESSWVQSYFLKYSTDGVSYSKYRGNITNFEHIQENVDSVMFEANFDGSTVVKNELTPPVHARFVSLFPHSFHPSIALRWEVYACPDYVDTPIGCYKDENADPDLPYSPPQDSFASISPASCIGHCSRQGYHYAGVENGTQCSCGNSYGMYGPSQDCSMLCSDPYSDSVCGGPSSNLIFSTGLGLSSLVCPDGWLSFRSKCYMLFAFNLSWFDAVYACGNMSSNLVDIQDHAENLFVTSLLSNIASLAWLGLNDYRRSLTYEWTSQSRVTYTNWGTHQPAVSSGILYHSVAIAQDGTWSTRSSDSKFPFLCETDKVQTTKPVNIRQDPGCPQGWFVYLNKCIQVNRMKNNWHDAKSVCELGGATLLHIDSSLENDFVSSLLTRSDGQYWIDIWDSNSTGLYQHSSGRADVYFTSWGIGQPDSDGQCVSVGSGYLAGSWSNDACDSKFRFLCQQPTNMTSSTTPFQQPTTQPALQCASGWLDVGDNQCVQFNSGNNSVPQLSWHEASENCKNVGASLVSFHSAQSIIKILDTLRQIKPDVGNLWIGLNWFDQSSGYSWADGSVFNFVSWANGQPQTTKDDICGELLTVSGKMGLQSCSQLKGWICGIQKGKPVVNVPAVVYPQPDKDGKCYNGQDIWIKYKGNCYYISDGQGGADRSLTWRESRDWCGMHNADLVSINSAEENLFLQGLLIYGIPAQSVWIGLNELERKSGYSWSDGSPLGKWGLNWNVNEPNDEGGFEACAELLVRNGKWNDQNCAKHQGFICKQLASGGNSSQNVPPTRPDGNCPNEFVKFGQKCFRVMGLDRADNKLSWKDAYTSCRNMKVSTSNNYTVDLASISSDLENALITTLLVGTKQPAWIGLKRRIGGQLYWSDNEDLHFENWNTGEPNMAVTDEGCVFIDGSNTSAGKWGDEVCGQVMAYVCQGWADPTIPPVFVPPSAKCDTTQGFQVFGTSCFKLVNQSATWQQAQQGCKDMGANLVSVLNAFDAAELLLLIRDFDFGVWIGLNDIQTPGTYVWDSGYPVTYTQWGQHQPLDESGWGCVYMTKNGYFNNGYCSGTKAFVCRLDYEPAQFTPSKLGGYCASHEFTLVGTICYLLMTNQSVSYDTALKECRNRQATLASVHADSNTLNISGTLDIWIGLRQSLKGGFYWDDGSAVDFTEWSSGQPDWSGFDEVDKGCVAMNSQEKWTNRHCQDQLGFLCSAPRSFDIDHPELTISSTTSSSVTLATSVASSSVTLATSVASSSQSTAISRSTLATTQSSMQSSQPSIQSSTGNIVTQAAAHGSKLDSGDIAGIVIGVILCSIVIVLLSLFLVKRYGHLKSSFLRQEASRSKNFENSLYEATHKDTLSKFDDEVDAVSILGLDSRGHHVSVSYTAKDRSLSLNPASDLRTREDTASYIPL